MRRREREVVEPNEIRDIVEACKKYAALDSVRKEKSTLYR